MNEADWGRRSALLWASIDELPEDGFLAAMEILVAELPEDDPVGLFEHASAFDSTGHPDLAVERYRQASARARTTLTMSSGLSLPSRSPVSAGNARPYRWP